MLYMLNARRAYQRISRGGESTDFPSFSDDPRAQAGRVEGTTSATRGGVYRGTPHRRRQAAQRKQTLTELVFERPRLRSNGEWGIDSTDDEDDGEVHGMNDLEGSGAGGNGSGARTGGSGGSSVPSGTLGQSSGTYTLTTLDPDGKPLGRARSRDSDGSLREQDRDRKVVDIEVSTEVVVERDDDNFGVRSLPYIRVCSPSLCWFLIITVSLMSVVHSREALLQ